MDTDAGTLIEKRDAAQRALSTREKEMLQIEEKFKKIKKMVAKVKLVLVDIESQREECTKSVTKNENVVKHWKKQFKSYQKKWKKLEDESCNEEENLPSESKDVDESKLNDTEIEKIDTVVNEDMDVDECKDGDKSIENNTKDTEKKEKVLQRMKPEELSSHDMEDVGFKIAVLEEERNKLKSTVNMNAITEYRKKHIEFEKRQAELDACTAKRDAERNVFDDLRKKRLAMFSGGFFTIKMKLKEMYRMLTLGGDAELEQVDTLDPFSEGILFSVRPPRKSWKSISNLSGGEKTLCSLALVFALHHFRPTPLYVMDEIDAALDFKNVSIIANYIKDRTKDAQFVVISLRNNMFELADRLVGIYKTENATKSVTINPKKLANLRPPESQKSVNNEPESVMKAKITNDSRLVLEDSTNTE